MLSSIHPLGERGRTSNYTVTVVSYIVGSVAGGLAMGTLLGALGAGLAAVVSPTPTAIPILVLLVAGAGTAIDLGIGNLSVPSYHRQVNEQWLARYRGWVYGSGFGFQLGLGFVTIVPTAGIYAVFALAVLSGSVGSGAVIGMTFGAVRSLMILMNVKATTHESLRASHRRLVATRPIADRIAIGAQGAMACLMVGVLIWL